MRESFGLIGVNISGGKKISFYDLELEPWFEASSASKDKILKNGVLLNSQSINHSTAVLC